ncbi:hypothetical protein GF312_22820 [Candidatus Poribacteria bacterium]|nr:hypothetical protein [Candidatus Poribacteria bacterium]
MFLEKYSMGIGDRFAKEGKAQLKALIKAREAGIDVVPVWNKSYREHKATGTSPESVRIEADEAVKALGWDGSYYVDADHIGINNVDMFIDSSDFFTIDVADYIGQKAQDDEIRAFVDKCTKYAGKLEIPGLDNSFNITKDDIKDIAERFLLAVKKAGEIYRHIENTRGKDSFITEVSMDETENPQTPVEMFFILAAISFENIPVQNIAPKFTGRFNKGVDYVGDTDQFALEFESDLAVIAMAVKEFGLYENLKLSIHSGSDKFSIYGNINRLIKKYNAGLHLKTAGTTWLEELIGLALAGGEGLELAKNIYKKALDRYDELCAPYAAVINIDPDTLPSLETIEKWSGEEYANALRHDQECPEYNLSFRQLLHIAYKVAADMGEVYINALDKFSYVVGENVTENIYQRHLIRVFG